MLVDAFGASEPFHDRFVAVTAVPLCDQVADQPWVTCWVPANENFSVQPLMVPVPVLSSVTAPVKPEPQSFTVYVTLQVAGLPVVGPPVVGPAVVGLALVGPAVVGPAVVGPAVVGLAVVGPAVVGPAVVGPAVVGPAVVGGADVGAPPGGLPQISVPAWYSVRLFVDCADQSFVGSQVPELWICSCTSRLNSDWPPGKLSVPVQSTEK